MVSSSFTIAGLSPAGLAALWAASERHVHGEEVVVSPVTVHWQADGRCELRRRFPPPQVGGYTLGQPARIPERFEFMGMF